MIWDVRGMPDNLQGCNLFECFCSYSNVSLLFLGNSGYPTLVEEIHHATTDYSIYLGDHHPLECFRVSLHFGRPVPFIWYVVRQQRRDGCDLVVLSSISRVLPEILSRSSRRRTEEAAVAWYKINWKTSFFTRLMYGGSKIAITKVSNSRNNILFVIEALTFSHQKKIRWHTSSMAVVTSLTWGNFSRSMLIPGGAEIRFRNMILSSGTLLSFKTSMALAALPPVASMGSRRNTYRWWISRGSFTYIWIKGCKVCQLARSKVWEGRWSRHANNQHKDNRKPMDLNQNLPNSNRFANSADSIFHAFTSSNNWHGTNLGIEFVSWVIEFAVDKQYPYQETPRQSAFPQHSLDRGDDSKLLQWASELVDRCKRWNPEVRERERVIHNPKNLTRTVLITDNGVHSFHLRWGWEDEHHRVFHQVLARARILCHVQARTRKEWHRSGTSGYFLWRL